MYHSWLDRWDERRASRGDVGKEVTSLTLDADLAFPGVTGAVSTAEFCALADQAVTDSASFYAVSKKSPAAHWEDGWITFTSSHPTNIENNDTVRAKVTHGGSSDQALIVFHHWNSTSRNSQLARFLAWHGITVVEVAMPYHLERARPTSSHADYMLSANLGRTIQSMRQAVLDGRQLIRILKDSGYETVSVLGISLGSWAAGLIAAHDPAIERAALFLTAGSLADMVWTGRATQHIRASLQDDIELADLRRAWSPLSLESFTDKLARPDLDLQLVLGKRDTVVLPELSERLIARLAKAEATPEALKLNCGHYSLSRPPYIVRAGVSLSRFLNHDR